MKVVNVTKNKTINLPTAFTMKELIAANPSTKKNTLYQRLQSFVRKGIHIKVVGDVKRAVKVEGEKSPVRTRGRTEIAYALIDASEGNNLIRQVKSQGVAKLKKQGVTVAKVGDTDSEVEVPVITSVEPLPYTTVSAIV